MPENMPLIARIAKRLAGKHWPREDPKDTTSGMSLMNAIERWKVALQPPSRERVEVYRDAEAIEETSEDLATALDILVDNVVNGEKGTDRAFTIVFEDDPTVPDRVKEIVEDTIARTRWQEKVYGFTKELLLYGDLFYEYVINEDLLITRLQYLPPDSMIRHEDEYGLLRSGNGEDDCAFEQIDPDTNKTIARFFPWQIEHVRWNRRGNSVYGRSMFYTARSGWRKLRALDEALVINWLTRAFARLMFTVDVTGKSPAEAALAIKEFQNTLRSQRISSGVEGATELSVVKDITVGKSWKEVGGKVVESLNDAKVLDTSNTGFWNLEAVRYFQGKGLTASRVPKAHLGLERDINAKATLQLQDKRFTRTIRRIQSVMSEPIRHTIELQLLLLGIDPAKVPFNVQWPAPSWMDEIDVSNFYLNMAQALPVLADRGWVDDDYIAMQLLNIPPSQWEAIKRRRERGEDYDNDDERIPRP